MVFVWYLQWFMAFMDCLWLWGVQEMFSRFVGMEAKREVLTALFACRSFNVLSFVNSTQLRIDFHFDYLEMKSRISAEVSHRSWQISGYQPVAFAKAPTSKASSSLLDQPAWTGQVLHPPAVRKWRYPSQRTLQVTRRKTLRGSLSSFSWAKIIWDPQRPGLCRKLMMPSFVWPWQCQMRRWYMATVMACVAVDFVE